MNTNKRRLNRIEEKLSPKEELYIVITPEELSGKKCVFITDALGTKHISREEFEKMDIEPTIEIDVEFV